MKQIYTKIVLAFIIVFICSATSFAQQEKSLWTKTTLEKASKKALVYRKTEPKKADFYKLNINALKVALQAAPNRKTFSGTSNVVIKFPTSSGSLESFRIKEAPIMEEALQNKFPDIHSYIGESIDSPGAAIRFSITPQGLHTMMLSPKNGTEFIDPFSRNGNDYIVYNKRDLPVYDEPWFCGVEDIQEKTQSESNNFTFQNRNADDGMLRDFRIAIATTIEYSSFHWMAAGLVAGDTEASKRTAVLAAIGVTLTRVNFIYERELSITMTLVGNNDSIVFIDSDNFTNDNAFALINESQTVIDNIIMPANYDIGHTFSTGGGGLAGEGPCGNFKASGITGSNNPVGDSYDVDFVAHEIGHQFGADHTFNGTTGQCTGSNRSAANAYEPGSGTTIMAYAGICAPQNVQNNSDVYFHQRSLQQIWNYVTVGVGQCSNQTSTNNNAPTSNAGGDFLIPISTPYKLTGTSTDGPEGTGTHTYTWEQYDLGQAGLPADANPGGPMVRSFEGTSNPSRYIPRLQDLAVSGGSTTWEKLASTARNQNFRLTVRDNDVAGGQTAVDEMTVTTINPNGPFLVTSQNTDGITWLTGETKTVTWDVAGTTANGIDTANVNILLSTDGGVTYDTTLATNVANDGSHDIVVPNIPGSGFCRVMVEAVGNIFFNINSTNFAVNATVTTTCNVYTTGPIATAIPDSSGADTQGPPVFIPVTVTETNPITDLKIYANVTHPNVSDLLLQIQPPAGFANIWARNCNTAQFQDLDITFQDGQPSIVCGNPTTGTFSPANTMNAFDGTDPSGTWNLVFADFNIGNTGTVNEWHVELCTTTTQILSVDSFNLENSFSVYPNPNNGEFNIAFNSTSKNIAISVFDVRGRSVYNKTYSNSGSFNEAINLGNVQSGMYLLNVNDGERTVTKKIIVE